MPAEVGFFFFLREGCVILLFFGGGSGSIRSSLLGARGAGERVAALPGSPRGRMRACLQWYNDYSRTERAIRRDGVGGTSSCGSGSREGREGLTRAGAVLPQVREGAGWREGGRAQGGHEEGGREEGARAHTCPGQRREPSCASLRPSGLRREEGGQAGRRGRDAEGRRRRRRLGWLGSRSFSLQRADPAHTLLLPLTHSPLGFPSSSSCPCGIRSLPPPLPQTASRGSQTSARNPALRA